MPTLKAERSYFQLLKYLDFFSFKNRPVALTTYKTYKTECNLFSIMNTLL